MGIAILFFFGAKCHRDPKVRARRKIDILIHDPNNFAGTAIELHSLPHNSLVAGELPYPQPLTEDHSRVLARNIFACDKTAPQCGANAQDVEEIRSDAEALHLDGLASTREVYVCPFVPSQASERAGFLFPIQKVSRRYAAPVFSLLARGAIQNHYQALYFRK